MSSTLGYHITKTTYGTWLPGDARGSWVKDWSPKKGYGTLHRFSEADPWRQEMAEREMNHDPVVLSEAMIACVIEAITECVAKSHGGLRIMAATIEPTHLHLLLPDTGRKIETTAKWIADQTTKAIHRRTSHLGPVWTSKSWCEHIADESHWEELLRYIDDHNVRAGRGSRPFPFLCDVEL
jgi:hypothetical protein